MPIRHAIWKVGEKPVAKVSGGYCVDKGLLHVAYVAVRNAAVVIGAGVFRI